MNISKFEKLSAKLVFTAAVIGLTLFAGAKHGSPTNTPPDNTGGSSPTNDPPVGGGVLAAPQSLTNEISLCGDCGVPGGHALPSLQIMLGQPPPSTSTFNLNLITNWHARGAWMDWTPIQFPAGFTFQTSTKQLAEVTLMSYGEIRSSLRGQTLANFSQLPTASCQLPTLLSLKPGVSSVGYGLTPSNSLVFAWQDCYENREPTNCVSAEIELFANGETAVRYRGIETRTPAPEVIGDGQDEDWIRVTFPDVVTNVLAMGYETWLTNVWVGVDEQNGHYQAAVTIPALPTDGSPCYLECGSFKVNVTAPGIYRFPLEVFETYEVHTTPTPVPFSIDFDDGYTGDGTSYEIVEVPDTPPLLMMAAPQSQDDNSTVNLNLQPQPSSAVNLFSPPAFFPSFRFYMQPKVIVKPSHIPLETAEGTHITNWCNVANVSDWFYRASREFYLDFCFPTEAEIIEAEVECTVEVIIEDLKGSCSGSFDIYRSNVSTNETNVVVRTDASVYSGAEWQSELTNDLSIVHLTAVTAGGSTEMNLATAAIQLLEGQSAYVGVFMASSEHPGDPLMEYYGDAVSWQVLKSGVPIMEGSASAFDWNPLTAMNSYAGLVAPVFLDGQLVEATSNETLHLRLVATAQNSTDGLRETAIQLVLYPIDENGNVIGLPSFAW